MGWPRATWISRFFQTSLDPARPERRYHRDGQPSPTPVSEDTSARFDRGSDDTRRQSALGWISAIAVAATSSLNLIRTFGHCGRGRIPGRWVVFLEKANDGVNRIRQRFTRPRSKHVPET